ncbi:MAG: hypothetical protein KDK70_10295 [Myxococcales bacterium]|nr:hypothetical protein [Myxococcales bacterium]
MTVLAVAAAPSDVGAFVRAPVDDAPADPDLLVEQARQRFEQGRFAEAAALLADLYAIDPRPEYLYSRGQALRLAGNCQEAIGALDAFLATSPPQSDVEDAEHWIARCREHLGATEPEAPPAIAPEPTPPSSPTQAPDEPPRWHRDPLAGSLLGLGLVGMGTGAGLVGGAFAMARADAPPGEGQAAHVERQRRVDRLATAGWSTLGVGSALVVGAIVRWAVVRRRSAAHARRRER